MATPSRMLTSPTAASALTGQTEKYKRKRKDSSEITDEELSVEDESPVLVKPPSNFVVPYKEELKETPLTLSNNHVYLSEVLCKYRPGFSKDYVEVSLKTTKEALCYYKRTCNCWLNGPLLKIQYSDIDRIERVNTRSDKAPKNYGREFEVFMKPSWYISKSKGIPGNIPKQTFKRKGSSYSPIKELTMFQSRNKTRFSRTVQGHLMLRPSMLDRYLLEMQTEEEKPEEKKEKTIHVGKIEFDSLKEAILYRKYEEENKARMTKIVDTTEELTLNPRSITKAMLGLTAWSNRELEWYLAEERLLFLAPSKEDCVLWITLLNWLCCMQK